MKKIAFPLFLLLFLFLLSPVSLAVPHEINFQGVLKDSAGPVNNPGLQMTFAIYSHPTNGTLTDSLWNETQNDVTVEAGLYTVQLGLVNAITPEVFDGSTRYLGVTVGTDPEMEPRIPLISVPYAFRAEHADVADTAGATTGGNADTLGGLSAENFVRLGTTSAQSTSQTNGLFVESTEIGGVGVRGYNDSQNGAGVLGKSDGTLGIGVHGRAGADNGRGVFGISTNATSGYGGQFRALGDAGIGVYGEAKSTSGTNYGVYGVSSSEVGTGVYGQATNTSGTNYGVYGESASQGGAGVRGIGITCGGTFEASATGAGTAFGVCGIAPYIGVDGKATGTTGFDYGGRFIAETPGDIGVMGWSDAGTGSGVGVVGRTDSKDGYAAEFNGGRGIILPTNSSNPSGTIAEGTIFFDSASHELKAYDGSNWIVIGP